MYPNSFYLYLTLDPAIDAKLPIAMKCEAFCSGFITGLYCADETEPHFVNLELGSTEQIESIIAYVDDFGENGYNPHSKRQQLVRNIRYFCELRSCIGEICDDDPSTTSPYGVQVAYITGYRAALNFKNMSNEQPIGFYPTPYSKTKEEVIADTRKMAAELLSLLSEF